MTIKMEVNKNYHENCLHTMGRMPSEFIDLTVTSPPYDKLRDYKGFKFPFKHIARHLYRVIKQGGVLVWVVADQTLNGSETGTSFRQALFFMECGFRLHDTMIYRKENFIPLTHNRYEQEFEYMFCFSKGRPKTFNPILEKSSTAGSVYNYSKKGSNIKEGGYRRRNELVTTSENKLHTNIFCYPTGASGTNHPAPFPEDLAKDQIFTWSNEGELVYDPFSGSGTTLKEAHLQNRLWLGSEISENYCQGSKKRLDPVISQLKLL
jgi:site-specific DNA-methyltransferase (adenine-specific)